MTETAICVSGDPDTSTTNQPTTQNAPTATGGFPELGLEESLLAALRKAKFHTPTDIQRELIPHALAGRDCLGQAKTGTGKTAAFALPMLQLMTVGNGLQALVLVPTRELAAQVDDHVRVLGAQHPVNTALVYGGKRITQQMTQLKRNPEVLIGTPGRVLDLMGRRLIDLSHLKLAILDEVDRMLDIGFRDDIRKILKAIKTPHQTIFVSATIDPEIRKLAQSFMRAPVEINVSYDTLTVESVHQRFVTVDPHDKFATLMGFLKQEKPTLCIVFTNTKHTARRLAERLKQKGVNCKEIHGDLIQRHRERVMESFRKSHIQVLVATDLASRGLDVMEISHIVNYDLPDDVSVYVHRIGRTARMGQKGYAFSFVTREQGKTLTEIEKLINQQIERMTPSWVVQRGPQPALDEQRPAARDTEGQPASEASETPETPDATPATGMSRLKDAMRRDPQLDALGLKPVPRTLGSRFKAARRWRP